MADPLDALRLSSARSALEAGDPTTAEEWLAGLGPSERPADLVAAVAYAMAKLALREQRWGEAERRLAIASGARVDRIHQERLGLLRKRSRLLDDRAWQTIDAAVEPARRLTEGALSPEVTGTWACGAYFSRGSSSGAPWSRFLRSAKEASEDREAVLSLACGFLCRFLAERTPLLGIVDLVVPVPANPDRYGQRLLSLPDELARSVEAQLSVPMRFDALSHSGDEVKMSQ